MDQNKGRPLGPCDSIMEVTLVFVKEIFKKEGTIKPVFVMVEDGGQCTPILCGFENDHEKAVTLQALRLMLAKNKATRYLMILECWMRKLSLEQFDPDKNGMSKDGLRPAEAPDRIEAVMIGDVSIDPATGKSRCRIVNMRIIRPENGPPTLADAVEFGTGADESILGAFSELLDPLPIQVPGIH